MKKLFLAFMAVLMVCSCAMAMERKPINKVDTDEFTADTQVTLKGAGDNHLALAWWIPNEFWKSVLSRDDATSEADKKVMLDAMSGVSLLAVVQADISSFGAFTFYTKEEIEKNMQVSFADDSGKQQYLQPMKKIDGNLEVVLGIFKPILGAAMGSMGNNMHFYVLNDRVRNTRLLDPYQERKLKIELSRKDGFAMNANIELPLNALFVPRQCPNGKDAHVSWNYCPWSGEKLTN